MDDAGGRRPASSSAILRWAHVPLFFWLVSITWFVRVYLGAGRRWLAWTISGLRAFALLLNFTGRAEPQLPRDHGAAAHPVSRRTGHGPRTASPIRGRWSASLSSVLLLVFVADASVTAWRRGDRRKALMVGGSVEFFCSVRTRSVSAHVLGESPGADYPQPVVPGPGRR